MFEMLAHKYGLGSKTLSPFGDSRVDNVLLQTNPDFTSRSLDNPSSSYGNKNLVCFYAPQCSLITLFYVVYMT